MFCRADVEAQIVPCIVCVANLHVDHASIRPDANDLGLARTDGSFQSVPAPQVRPGLPEVHMQDGRRSSVVEFDPLFRVGECCVGDANEADEECCSKQLFEIHGSPHEFGRRIGPNGN